MTASDKCLVSTHQSDDITCETATNTVTITVATTAVEATTWTIITRNVLSSTTFGITSITSETTSGVTIDESTSTGVTITHPIDTFQVVDDFRMVANDGTALTSNADIPGSVAIMFYVDNSSDIFSLEDDTNAVFYVPFLVQS